MVIVITSENPALYGHYIHSKTSDITELPVKPTDPIQLHRTNNGNVSLFVVDVFVLQDTLSFNY